MSDRRRISLVLAKALSTFAIVLTSLIAQGDETKNELKIGYYALPPHAVNNSGTPGGAAIGFLSEHVFPESEYRLSWEFFPFARVLEQLRLGLIDCGILIAKTDERNSQFTYPDDYLYQTQSGIITLTTRPALDLSDFSSLKGLKLGHVTDSVRPQQLLDAGVVFEDISGVDNLERNILKLQRERIDGVYVPTLSHAKYLLNKMFDHDHLSVQALPIGGYKLFVVFRKDIEQEVLDDYKRVNHQDYKAYLSNF